MVINRFGSGSHHSLDGFGKELQTAFIAGKSRIDCHFSRHLDYLLSKEATMVVLAVTWMAKARARRRCCPDFCEVDGRIPQGAGMPDVPGTPA